MLFQFITALLFILLLYFKFVIFFLMINFYINFFFFYLLIEVILNSDLILFLIIAFSFLSTLKIWMCGHSLSCNCHFFRLQLPGLPFFIFATYWHALRGYMQISSKLGLFDAATCSLSPYSSLLSFLRYFSVSLASDIKINN